MGHNDRAAKDLGEFSDNESIITEDKMRSLIDLLYNPGAVPDSVSLQDPTLREQNKQGKLPLHLVPASWERFLAEVFEAGAKKYPEGSWTKYTNSESMLASARRHILYFREGQDLDKETELSHLAHAAWNLLAVLDLYTQGKITDRGNNEK